MARQRLDKLVVERGLVESRERAQAVIMAGSVVVAGRKVDKPGALVDEGVLIELLTPLPFVSRGGIKLEHALHAFGIDVAGLVAADVGASTGGFTDCLLQHGGRRVYAIDVGYGQLDYRLRSDPRVVPLERVNIRHLQALPEKVELATIDVSFISLSLVLPAVNRLLDPAGRIIALVKPQFEAGRQQVGKGGVVRDPAVHSTVLHRVANVARALGLAVKGVTSSPILGPAGNREFLMLLDRRPDGINLDAAIAAAVLD